MVDQDLQQATDQLVGELVEFDIVTLLTGGVSLGAGLFVGEVLGNFVRGMLSGQRPTIRTLAGLAARGAFSAILVAARGMFGPLADVAFGMAAFGNVVGMLFELLEGASDVVADLLAGTEIVGSQQQSQPSADQELGEQSYGEPSASTGGNAGGSPDIAV